MKIHKKLSEEIIIFFSIFKWFALASIIGTIVGSATALFLKLLTLSVSIRNYSPHYFLALPFAFFASSYLVTRFASDAEGHGTEKVIEAVHKRAANIDILVVPVKLAATIITLAFGGSAGKEGPCAQIGAALASYFSNLFNFDSKDRKKIVICGISAGFAAVFGTPLAGAVFGVEVLFIGSIMYDTLLPSLISGVVSCQVAGALGIAYASHKANFIPQFSEAFFIEIFIAGIFFGICSILFIECMKLGENISKKIKYSKPFKGLIGGLILITLALVFSDKFLGLGVETIESCLPGESNFWYAFNYLGINTYFNYSGFAPGDVLWYAFLVKIVFTTVTLAFGGSGGVVTPIFFIGSTAGAAFANLTGLDPYTFSAIGFVAVLAGAANTPIAASLMALEIFGSPIAPYAATACVVSFLMSGHRSIYSSQVLLLKKSESINVELGKDINDIATDAAPREKSLLKKLLGMYNKNIRR